MSRKRPLSESDIEQIAAATGKRKKIRRSPVQDAKSNADELDRRTLSLDAAQQSPGVQHNARSWCADDHRDNHQSKNRETSPSASLTTSVDRWIHDLAEPSDFDDPETMSVPSRLKRTRSASDASDTSFQSDAETESGASRKSSSSIYKDSRYPTMMVRKGCVMQDALDGLLPEEVDLCIQLLTKAVPLPSDLLFEPQYLPRFRAMLQDRSELCICTNLHHRLIPAIEVYGLLEDGKFEHLIEGYNDRWLDATVFYAQLPQPDRTVAHRPSAFTDHERRKLEAVSGGMTRFSARAGMMFPFATCEVKCGKEALLIADRANLNSMAVASHMIIDLHRLVGNVMVVHRKCLGFSMSHDDGTVRIYAHYARIEGDQVILYRKTLRDYAYTDKECADSRTSWRFFWNVCDVFALSHRQMIKEAIGRLPDTPSQSVRSRTVSDPATSVRRNSEALTPATSNSEAAFLKPSVRQRVTNTVVMQKLDQQQKDFMAQLEQQQREAKARLEQQQQEAKDREDKLTARLEQQQQEAKDREDKLIAQLSQQQKETKVQLEQQRSEAKEREGKLVVRLDAQHTELLKILQAK